MLLICLLVLYSCDRNTISCDNCKVVIGDLLFDTGKIEWGEVHLGGNYENSVKVHNPTRKDISMKIFTRLSELHMAKFGRDSIGCINKEIVLPALTCDSLRFILCHAIHR